MSFVYLLSQIFCWLLLVTVNGVGSTCCFHVYLNTWKLKQDMSVSLMLGLWRVDIRLYNTYSIVHNLGKLLGIVG